jgi:hypothetical protein
MPPNIAEYGRSVDNWRVDCELGFGVKDHYNILSFFFASFHRNRYPV